MATHRIRTTTTSSTEASCDIGRIARLITRRELLRQIALGGGGALLVACTATPSAPTVAAPAVGPTGTTHVVFGAANEPGGFNPLLADTGSSAASWELLYESLTLPDPRTGAPGPGLAEGGPLGLTNDPDQSVLWSSAGIAAGTNFTHYTNPRVDQLLEQARAAPGCAEADRKPLYDQFQQVIADDKPFTFLYTAKTTVVYNKRLHDVSPSPWRGTAPYVSWGIKSWKLST